MKFIRHLSFTMLLLANPTLRSTFLTGAMIDTSAEFSNTQVWSVLI